jgi:hypothetical protein
VKQSFLRDLFNRVRSILLRDQIFRFSGELPFLPSLIPLNIGETIPSKKSNYPSRLRADYFAAILISSSRYQA